MLSLGASGGLSPLPGAPKVHRSPSVRGISSGAPSKLPWSLTGVPHAAPPPLSTDSSYPSCQAARLPGTPGLLARQDPWCCVQVIMSEARRGWSCTCGRSDHLLFHCRSPTSSTLYPLRTIQTRRDKKRSTALSEGSFAIILPGVPPCRTHSLPGPYCTVDLFPKLTLSPSFLPKDRLRAGQASPSCFQHLYRRQHDPRPANIRSTHSSIHLPANIIRSQQHVCHNWPSTHASSCSFWRDPREAGRSAAARGSATDWPRGP